MISPGPNQVLGLWNLREKENAEVYNNYSGLVLDPAEIISPSHITQQLTINKNVHIEDSSVLEEEKRGKSVLHAPPHTTPYQVARSLEQSDIITKEESNRISRAWTLASPTLKTWAAHLPTQRNVSYKSFFFPIWFLHNQVKGKTSIRKCLSENYWKTWLLSAEMSNRRDTCYLWPNPSFN